MRHLRTKATDSEAQNDKLLQETVMNRWKNHFNELYNRRNAVDNNAADWTPTTNEAMQWFTQWNSGATRARTRGPELEFQVR